MFYNVSAKVSRNGLVGKAVFFSFCCTTFILFQLLCILLNLVFQAKYKVWFDFFETP